MSPSLIGKTLLNRYHIEEFITRTPLGELHRATDERSNTFVALTILPKSITDNTEAIKELESKSKSLQEISHPNLIKYFGLRQTPTHAFLLEDWVDGPSLKHILAKAPISTEEALFYAKALANALDALHKKNFLHLNLAPELIHINTRGEIKLGGIANAQPASSKAPRRPNGYPPVYTSPEHLRNETLNPAADIYSLAVILYELITKAWINGKQNPKAHDSIRKTHLDHAPPAPISLNKRIPDHFSRMVLWALRKNPDDRLKTATELISSLALALRVSQDDIPLRADHTTAPVTWELLQAWELLPPPQPTSIQNDAPPIEERVAALAAPKKKKPRINLIPILLLLVFTGLFAIFWFVRPAEDISIELPPTPTRFIVNYTPPPTITPEPRPTLTNGGRIVFTCTRGNYNQLCMINRDGTELLQLTDMAASNYYPTFTIERDAILFASNRAGKFDLYLLAFNLKQTIQMTSNVGDVVSPDYSPDGRTIVFANRVGDNPTAIWMVNADGLNPRLVYTGARDIVAVKWSPNGEQVAYAMSIGTAQDYEIFVMDANGRNHRRISERLRGVGGSINWAADGSHVLIHAGPFGDKNIFRLDVNSGDFVQLTRSGNNAGASYSPDGRYIVFNSLRNENQADLYIMRADGTNEVQLTFDPEPDWGAQWVE
jgi:Tol biopolymer transport system component/serine/threonine protein kinase